MLKLSNNPKILLPLFSASPSPSSQLSNNPTPPASSTSSASSFEFTTVSLSPRKCSTAFNPTDELFYKGQTLPLQPSPRISILRALLLASSSVSSSSDTTTTGSRDSSGSSNDSNSSFPPDLILLPECDSSRPSSVNEDDDFRRISNGNCNKKAKYFAKLTKFSSVFRKDPAKIRRREAYSSSTPSSVKRMSATSKEVLRKYFKKLIPCTVIKDYKLQLPRETIIRDTQGRKWATKLVQWANRQLFYQGGWGSFFRVNQVEEEDLCICEIMEEKNSGGLHFYVYKVEIRV